MSVKSNSELKERSLDGKTITQTLMHDILDSSVGVIESSNFAKQNEDNTFTGNNTFKDVSADSYTAIGEDLDVMIMQDYNDDPYANQTYVKYGVVNGKPAYRGVNFDSYTIQWTLEPQDQWELRNNGEYELEGEGITDYPHLATWAGGIAEVMAGTKELTYSAEGIDGGPVRMEEIIADGEEDFNVMIAEGFTMHTKANQRYVLFGEINGKLAYRGVEDSNWTLEWAVDGFPEPGVWVFFEDEVDRYSVNDNTDYPSQSDFWAEGTITAGDTSFSFTTSGIRDSYENEIYLRVVDEQIAGNLDMNDYSIYLNSPNGTKYKIKVSDSGDLITESV